MTTLRHIDIYIYANEYPRCLYVQNYQQPRTHDVRTSFRSQFRRRFWQPDKITVDVHRLTFGHLDAFSSKESFGIVNIVSLPINFYNPQLLEEKKPTGKQPILPTTFQ